MRLYYEIGLRAFRRATTYRSSYIAGILTNAFFGAVLSYIYMGLYANGGSIAGFTLEDALSYTWVAQALISIGAAWTSRDIAPTIRSGDVVIDMSRPWSFYGYWLSRSLGERISNLLLRGSITYLIGVLYFGARIPTGADLLRFVVVIALSMLISFAISFMINLTAFWLLDSSGVTMLADISIMFFSGFLLPLAFFPPFLATVAWLLPFQTIANTPALTFLGKLEGPEFALALGLQSFWLVVLTGLALLLQRAAFTKVIIQGG